MRAVRLIKKDAVSKQLTKPMDTLERKATLKRTVSVVKDWIKERRTSPQQQARQVFASLFTHPQGES